MNIKIKPNKVIIYNENNEEIYNIKKYEYYELYIFIRKLLKRGGYR